MTEKETIDGLHAVLSEAVRGCLPDEGTPTALQLSGGLDSSLLGFLCKEHRPLPNYSITFQKKRYRSYDESKYARQVAALLGTKTTEFDYDFDVNDHYLDTLRGCAELTCAFS